MPLNLPEGKKIAVNIGADFDAHAVWMGTFGKTSPSYLSRGEYCATVGVPRLLDLFARYDIQGTWCTPVHTMETFPEPSPRSSRRARRSRPTAATTSPSPAWTRTPRSG